MSGKQAITILTAEAIKEIDAELDAMVALAARQLESIERAKRCNLVRLTSKLWRQWKNTNRLIGQLDAMRGELARAAKKVSTAGANAPARKAGA